LCTAQDIQQQTVTAEDDVTLPCTFATDYPTWTGPELHNGYTQQYNNHGQSSFPNPNVPEQKRLRLGWADDKSSLIIRDVIFSDRGLYQCSLVKINLSIRVPPRSPMISNTEISADDTLIIKTSESQETSLVCTSSGGYPQPLVQWYRGNTPDANPYHLVTSRFTHDDFKLEETNEDTNWSTFPVIVSLDAKIASRLNRNITVEVEYFSNIAGSDVKLYKIVNDAMKAVTLLSVNPVEIKVPVLSHLIKAKGTRAYFTVQIKSEEDYGFYYVVVSNIIGSSNKSFEIIPTKPPVSPSDFTIDYIQHNKARLSWRRGYNGGLTQTFVIQLGTDEKWNDVEVFDRNTEDRDRISTILTDLFDSTTYFVRLYAYNEEGNSPLSETLYFTTSPIKGNNFKLPSLSSTPTFHVNI
ncbi:neural cell adhesion molecule 1-B-like, partial [Ruditapes philippinarum]|uniref:neural cell adhesion molecule 1-B-like n=1 Tax=Ruditapes philippinarum TaxID=129788 RepID=UPI00295B8C34